VCVTPLGADLLVTRGRSSSESMAESLDILTREGLPKYKSSGGWAVCKEERGVQLGRAQLSSLVTADLSVILAKSCEACPK
jgi:hypothetical protein